MIEQNTVYLRKLKKYKDAVLEFHQELKLAVDGRVGSVGERIRHKRKEHNLTLAQVAELLDISRTQLTNIELGNSVTSLKTLVKICDVLDTDPNYLLGYDS